MEDTVEPSSNSASTETETVNQIEKKLKKPKVIVVYGHHARSEAIGKKISPRLKNSRAAKRTELSLVEQPGGLCYVDAYINAKRKAEQQKIDIKSSAFRKLYQEERLRLLQQGYKATYDLAKSHPDTTIFDIHETPADDTDEGLWVSVPRPDGDDLKELGRRLREVLPLGKSQKLHRDFSIFVHETGTTEGLTEQKPENLITLELLVNPDLYDHIAALEEANISTFGLTAEVRELKRQEDITTKQRVNQEAVKYSRILELAIPVIAEFEDKRRKQRGHKKQS